MNEEDVVEANAGALRALRSISGDPTPDQVGAMSRWVGFADPDARRFAFGYGYGGGAWQRDCLLSRDEAEEVVRHADLCPPAVSGDLARVVWLIAEALAEGSAGLRVLDPCPGAGAVLRGLSGCSRVAPAVIAAPCPCPVSSALLRALLPGVSVLPDRLPPAGALFDMVVGAAPDRPGSAPEEDGRDLPCKYLSASRAGWYVSRAVSSLRPGGIAVLLVDRDFLDREDARTRSWVGARAELLGAARLPGGPAGREGALDLLVLRRLRRGADPSALPWTLTRPRTVGDDSGRQIHTNVLWDLEGARVFGEWTIPEGEYLPRLVARDGEDVVRLLEGWAGEVLPRGALAVDPPRPARRAPPRRRSDDPAEAVALDLLRAVRRAFEIQESGEGDPLPAIQAAARRHAALVASFGALRTAERDRNHPLRRATAWPEWTLLRALEEPDGTPSALLRGRALRGRPGNVSPADAREALARSLDLLGRPDLEQVARDVGATVADVELELGDEVFRDPSGRGWRHAPEYLSGDVRARLREARAAAALDPRLARNVAALERVVPPRPARVAESSDSAGPDDVVVPLGAFWIPPEMVREFVAHLVGARRTYGLEVSRVAATGTWTVKCSTPAILRSVENTMTWGVPGMPALDIVEALLNLKQVSVTRREADPETGKDRDVRDLDATAAAAGKAEAVRAEWPRWLRADPARESAVIDAWAERFGGFVRRRFDGSHLSFPGLSLVVDGRPFEPRRHQRALVDRIASRSEPDDAVLAVHLVGYGKTFSGLAGCVRRWQLGLSDLLILVVPGGQVFGQWREAVGKFFPSVADRFLFGPSDWARDGAAFLRRIADGEAPFAVLTYEQFAAIPPSSEMLREHLEGDLPELREALEDADKGAAKVLKAAISSREKSAERHLEAHGKRLEKLVERATRSGQEFLTWEDVVGGATDVTLLFDEYQYLKRIPVPTRMERVYGLARGESYRAVDALAKVRRTLRRGGKVVGQTGTPVTNTLGEGKVSQDFFQAERLRLCGIRNFDDWASTFAEQVVSVEMDAVGGFRPVTRLRMINIPELLEILGEAWDFASHVEEIRRPDLVGGKMRIVEVPGGPELRDYVRELADRAEMIRSREVAPSEDNMLKVTSDGRRASMWNGRPGETFPRPPDAPEHEPGCPLAPGACTCRPRRVTKLDVSADLLWETYAEHYDERGVSLVFLDLGTPKGEPDADATPEEQFRRRGLYGELKDRLISRGVLPDHVAFVHDAGNDVELAEMFRRVNAGEIRILMGSTAKLGVGTNPQRRVVMVLHLDAPWRPDELIQRGGRGRRDGNLWKSLHEVAVVTSHSYDAALWQLLQVKADFVAKFQSGVATSRVADDVGDLLITAGMAKAIALGDQRILAKVKTETALAYLERQRRAFEQARARSEAELAEVPRRIARLREEAEATSRARSALPPRGDFRAELRDVRSPDRHVVKNVAEADARVYALSNVLRSLLRKPMPIGGYRGGTLSMEIKYGAVAVVLDVSGIRLDVLNVHSTGTFAALDRELGMLDVREAALKKSVEAEEAREASLRAEAGRTWDRAGEAEALREEYDRLCAEIAGETGLVDRRRFDL